MRSLTTLIIAVSSLHVAVAQVIKTTTAVSKNGKLEVFADLERCGEFKLGAMIRDSYGASIGDVCQDGREFLPSTGFLYLTASQLPDLFIASQVGAKSMEASVLSYFNGKYRITGNWSGWKIEPITVSGRSGLIVKQYENSLTLAYFWNGSSFQEKILPQLSFVRDELAESEEVIRSSKAVPAYVLVDACRRIVVIYSAQRRPEAARPYCDQARSRVLTSQVISTRKGQPLSDEERQASVEEIDAIIQKIPPNR